MPTQPAILGTMRLGNVRLGYVPAALAAVRRTKVTLLLSGVPGRIRTAGLTISDILNDAPNTCSLVVDNANPPTVEQDVRISLGVDAPRLLFGGTLQTVDLTYAGRSANRLWPCTAIDYTARLNRRRPFGTFVNISATTIAQSLVATYAPAFGLTHIAAGLPLVSIIFDGSTDFIGCLAQLATAIGGYTKVDDLDVYLFQTDTADAPDAIDSTPGRFLNNPPITCSQDVSQLRTRVFGKGHGEVTLSDVLAGETIVPIADAVMFGTIGGVGKALAGTTPDGAQSQQIAYTGVRQGGAGSLVGPGGGPSVAPTLALNAGAGLGTGAYSYAYTDVTAAGESLPSALGSITTRASVTPPVAPTFIQSFAGTTLVGTYHWACTFLTAAGETVAGAQLTVTTGSVSAVQVSLPIGPAGVTGRNLYRTVQAGSQLKLVATINNNTATAYNDGVADGSLGANAPTADSTGGNQVIVWGIALGAAGTTSRKVYRTAVGGSQLKLLTTIANNTTTTISADTLADGSLGANAPTADTSGLSFVVGQALAGSASLVMASAGPFPAAGWVLLAGGQAVRYTGITGNTLTGIPATGPGAILTTVVYGSPVLPAPSLTGVTGLALAMLAGTPVSIWVQRDDVAAQATQAALDTANGITPADGICDGPIVSDERRGEASLIALCDANLQLYSRPIVTFTYATRDPKTRSGKTVHINLSGYPVGDYVIQEVTITELDAHPGTGPRFGVTASTVRFSLDDLLRRLLTAQAA